VDEVTGAGGRDEPPGEDRETLRARKAALRRATRAAREELRPDARTRAAADVVTRLARLPELRGVRVVALYAAHGTELDVGAVATTLRERGATTCLPRVEGEHLHLVATTATSPLEVGYRGIAEPRGRSLDPGAVDAVVVPGLAFDPVGGRLGQGGGHYDRLLSQLPARALRVGVGFACQLVPRVPREAHDAPVDVVVTDRATYRTGARS
jgi:5-formyltetrahydrofolate cyclo-ligase